MAQRKDQSHIAYVDVVLSNGVVWRMDPRSQTVYEIEHMPGDTVPTHRGPVAMDDFVTLLKARRKELGV